jgi:uncharacterized protein (DUF433 family)
MFIFVAWPHGMCDDVGVSETAVMTLRMPKGVKRGVERLAARFGHKPAQLGARLIEEGLRRRDFPHVELRETAAGRMAYVAGTRLAVHWVAERVARKISARSFAREHDLTTDHVRAALAYAQAFPDEIRSDREHAEANRKWIEVQDAVTRGRKETNGHGKRKSQAQ